MMRRENRYLLLFAVGMMALLTVLRILYPNEGGEASAGVGPPPDLVVAVEASLEEEVRRFARGYELNHSVPVRLEDDSPSGTDRCDVLVLSGGREAPEAQREFPLPRSEGGARVLVFSRDPARYREALRFARLLSEL